MERLTMKNSDGTYSQPTHTTFEKMFYKLAEFEDFMEENEWDSIEEMKSALNQCEQKYFKMHPCRSATGNGFESHFQLHFYLRV